MMARLTQLPLALQSETPPYLFARFPFHSAASQFWPEVERALSPWSIQLAQSGLTQISNSIAQLASPTDGEFQALISTGARGSEGAVSQADLETFLGLAPTSLDSLGNGDATGGAAIKTNLFLEAGDVLTFDWNFLTFEDGGSSGNDFAFFSLTPLTLELADTTSDLAPSSTGGFLETGYHSESILISETGEYVLSFGVVDVDDNAGPSGLLIDNVQVSAADASVADSLGDTFGSGPIQLDIASVGGNVSNEILTLSMGFSTPIAAPSAGSDNSVIGFWDLDLDQNLDTGIASNQSVFAPPDQQGGLLGVDVYVNIGSEQLTPGFVDLIETSTGIVIGSAPIVFSEDSLAIQIPLALLNDDGSLNYGTVIGTFNEPTDAAPDSGIGTIAPAIVNDSFETGTFSGWQTIGTPIVIDGGSAPGSLEPNDTLANAILVDLSAPGSAALVSTIGDNPALAPTDDVDLFAIQMGAGDQIAVDIDANAIGSDLDSILSIFDVNGTLLSQNDDSDGVDSFLSFTATTNSTYYIGVSSFANFSYDPLVEGSGSGSSAGDYNLSIVLSGVEPNNTLTNAVATGLTGAGSFTLSSEIGDNPNLAATDDVDLFEIVLFEGNKLSVDIDAAAIGSELDPVLSLFDADGTLLSQNDDTDGLDSFLDATAPDDGIYYIGVSSFANFGYDPLVEGSGSGFTAGAYDLSISVSDEGDGGGSSGFDIVVNFIDDTLTPSQQAVFTTAADVWETIITADLPDVFLPDVGFIDDVVIDASAPAIDGPGGILGQAGPTDVRDGSLLPSQGVMEFDSADLTQLENEGQLATVILHEMGHVLGIGTLWQPLDLLTGINGSSPLFIGENAIAEYNQIFSVNEAGVPVEADGGRGTALGHWDEEIFDNELMTGFVNDGPNPLSRITVASLADLGYEVDLAAADVYFPPSLSTANSGLATSSSLTEGTMISLGYKTSPTTFAPSPEPTGWESNVLIAA